MSNSALRLCLTFVCSNGEETKCSREVCCVLLRLRWWSALRRVVAAECKPCLIVPGAALRHWSLVTSRVLHGCCNCDAREQSDPQLRGGAAPSGSVFDTLKQLCTLGVRTVRTRVRRYVCGESNTTVEPARDSSRAQCRGTLSHLEHAAEMRTQRAAKMI